MWELGTKIAERLNFNQPWLPVLGLVPILLLLLYYLVRGIRRTEPTFRIVLWTSGASIFLCVTLLGAQQLYLRPPHFSVVDGSRVGVTRLEGTDTGNAINVVTGSVDSCLANRGMQNRQIRLFRRSLSEDPGDQSERLSALLNNTIEGPDLIAVLIQTPGRWRVDIAMRSANSSYKRYMVAEFGENVAVSQAIDCDFLATAETVGRSWRLIDTNHCAAADAASTAMSVRSMAQKTLVRDESKFDLLWELDNVTEVARACNARFIYMTPQAPFRTDLVQPSVERCSEFAKAAQNYVSFFGANRQSFATYAVDAVEDALRMRCQTTSPDYLEQILFFRGIALLNLKTEHFEERALEDLSIGLTRPSSSSVWAKAHANVGMAHTFRIHALSNQFALKHEELAARTFGDGAPADAAAAHSIAASAYINLAQMSEGAERESYLNEAEKSATLSVSLRPKSVDPSEWARKMMQLGRIYRLHEGPSRVETAKKAIAFYADAGEVFEKFPDMKTAWAETVIERAEIADSLDLTGRIEIYTKLIDHIKDAQTALIHDGNISLAERATKALFTARKFLARKLS
jgi:hypothetical protein